MVIEDAGGADQRSEGKADAEGGTNESHTATATTDGGAVSDDGLSGGDRGTGNTCADASGEEPAERSESEPGEVAALG